MLKKVMIKISSHQDEISDELFSSFFGEENFSDGDFNEIDEALEKALLDVADVKINGEDRNDVSDDTDAEIYIEGRLHVTNDRVTLSYEESEITGMAGAKTTVSYSRSNPDFVMMVRRGTVNTALVFEPKKRHICSYNTPYMPFEICVRTLSIDNRLHSDSEFSIEYVIEIRGATAERNYLQIKLFDNEDKKLDL